MVQGWLGRTIFKIEERFAPVHLSSWDKNKNKWRCVLVVAFQFRKVLSGRERQKKNMTDLEKTVPICFIICTGSEQLD